MDSYRKCHRLAVDTIVSWDERQQNLSMFVLLTQPQRLHHHEAQFIQSDAFTFSEGFHK
jgi:hypothetical protein